MFKEPELAPDLEWLLQSQDAPTPVLAEALVEAFFPSLFTTACALIDNREMAWAMTVASIRDMLLAVYRYKAGTNPDSWARRIATESFLGSLTRPAGQENGALRPPEARPGSPLLVRFDALAAVPRLAVALSILQGLTPKEIGQALGIGERLAAAELERAAGSLGEGPLPERLWTELAQHRPTPVITQEHLDQAVQQVLARSEEAAVRTRRATRMKESLWIVVAILLIVVLAWGINYFLPEETPNLQQRAPREGPPGAFALNLTPTPAPPAPTRTPAPTPGRTPYTPPFPQDVFYTVRMGDTWQSIAASLDTTEEELARLNRVPPGETPLPGEALLIPGRLTPAPLLESTQSPDEPVPAPLSVDSSLDEISGRLKDWTPGRQSIYFNAQITFMNPRGFESPLQRYRIQAWLGGSPQRMLILSGPSGQKPSRVLMAREGTYYLARPDEGQPWFTEWQGDEGMLQAYPLLLLIQLVGGGPLQQYASGPVRPVDTSLSAGEPVAGQETILLEVDRSPNGLAGRFWIDAQTGLPLRQAVVYTGNDFPARYQLEMTQFVFPAASPGELLDPWLPWRGGYARDASGLPEAGRPGLQMASLLDLSLEKFFNRQATPEGQGSTRLTFSSLHSYNLFKPWETPETEPVRVFSGSQNLGTIPLPNPIFISCARSPDGNRVAFSSLLPLISRVAGNYLHWFALDEMEVHHPASNLLAAAYSFAPDSHRLAVLAPREDQAGTILQRNWGLFIVDTLDGRVEKLMEIDGRRPPVWSADGALLAVTGHELRGGSEQIFVVDTATGEVHYKGLIDYENLANEPRLPKTWPYPDWPIDLTAPMGGLEACSSPAN